MILSGSNMSGKSTLLRTVGINAVLALAGAPVCASRMRLSPLILGASIRVQDSIQGGISRFYAEIQRIKRIADLAGKETPILFLLDEILQGTNSHDREIGARAILERLIQEGALGIATTHDLALTRIVDSLSPRAINAHFEDQFEENRLLFDYRLREGVVQKSNALALMKGIGLIVENR
jgi:DNA mismatch repair ATPase MutS